jgi:hypothetical protein
MTVTELIAALQGYPPDAVVCIDRAPGDVEPLPMIATELGTANRAYDSIACEWITTVAVVIA